MRMCMYIFVHVCVCPGVNHDELVRTAQAFSNIPEGIELTEVQAEYIGGETLRITIILTLCLFFV